MQVKQIERVQKVALKIILGNRYHNYESACEYFAIDTLSHRRHLLATKFAVKLNKSKRCEEFFQIKNVSVNTRQKSLVVEEKCRTKRFFNSPLNYLTRLVNQNAEKILKNSR